MSPHIKKKAIVRSGLQLELHWEGQLDISYEYGSPLVKNFVHPSNEGKK